MEQPPEISGGIFLIQCLRKCSENFTTHTTFVNYYYYAYSMKYWEWERFQIVPFLNIGAFTNFQSL